MNENNGWISVKDRLPEFEEKVIIYENGIVDTARRIKLENHLDKTVFDNANWFDFAIDTVTHWMPLPQPPKTSDKT